MRLRRSRCFLGTLKVWCEGGAAGGGVGDACSELPFDGVLRDSESLRVGPQCQGGAQDKYSEWCIRVNGQSQLTQAVTASRQSQLVGSHS